MQLRRFGRSDKLTALPLGPMAAVARAKGFPAVLQAPVGPQRL